MSRNWSQGQKLLYAAVLGAVLVFSILGFLLYRVITNAAEQNVSGQTSAASSSAALAIQNTIHGAVQSSQAVVREDGLSSIITGEADRLLQARVQYANLNLQRANPSIVSLYFYDNQPSFVFGQVVDPTHQAQNQQGSSCDNTGVYCTTSNIAGGAFVSGTAAQSIIKQELRTGAQPVERLVFGRDTGPYGSLYLFLPIPSASGGATLGVLVEELDASSIFGPYIQPGSHTFILSGPIVIDSSIGVYHTKGELPVTTLQGLDATGTGGLKPTLVGYSLDGATPRFTLSGTAQQGSRSPVTMAGLSVVNYAAASALSDANARVIFFAVAFFIILIASIVFLSIYLERRLQQGQQESALLIRAKSEALTEDIVVVSQALAVAREGDLTVQVPDSESEVGLLALSLNGLISDYSQIVGGIMRASQAVQDGAARVDEGVRRIVEVATDQAESVVQVASSVEEVASSAVDVQQATTIAITLAANARGAVQSGQQSVSRIGEAVDSIKEAAIGTTREFKRLQEDSIRLTALVASVKSNAENLDMQAANATLEARHLGTESGSAFATNIGRLARQAQDTLADAEGAVRSVVTSIDEVNRRIERISEQVRRGVEEVRAVRSTFEDITQTNTSLVQFIDNVADSAGVQAQSAQQAAYSISEIAQVFEQFTELLITSGDEIANMRLIVAGLRESVADLKVEEGATLSEPPMGTESAA